MTQTPKSPLDQWLEAEGNKGRFKVMDTRRTPTGTLQVLLARWQDVPPDDDELPTAAAELAALRSQRDDLLASCQAAFELIRESGFRSGLDESVFDATLTGLGNAIARATGQGE